MCLYFSNLMLGSFAFSALSGVSVRRSLLFSWLLFLLSAGELAAQIRAPDLPANSRPFDFYDRGPYNSELARPSDFLGYEPGEFLTSFASYEALLHEYQKNSDRLRVLSIGKTPEHRTQYLL